MIEVTPSIAIDEAEIHERFIRAGGPGGQNVNKVASAVQLRFDAAGSPSLPDDVKARLRRVAGARMSSAGVIVITARRFRDQARNRADARARLAELIARAAEAPTPRRPNRIPPGVRAARLENKARRSTAKRLRARPSEED